MIELFRLGFITITLIDVIDVVVIGLLFYAVYRTLRDTIAVQVLLLLLFLLALGFITEATNLKTANWVLRRLADIGLIAFVVLFQPELRRVLLLLTQSRWLRLFVRSNDSQTVDDVAEAVMEMSAKHIGALTVFSRAEHIQMTIETGVELQAAVSKELLISIFNPRSPLHDGAVVIDGRTMVAARCVLPLSNEQRIAAKNLGTRHRAAIGMTEQADAVVLVVSEETGAVSIAYQGELEFDLPKDTLRETLQERISAIAAV
ncbi:MAG: TIGR00159 family protein [Ignavibacteriae bacterium]|nr:MAG: TIGR00159 family protein [Ignavibacteriota bacterium]